MAKPKSLGRGLSALMEEMGARTAEPVRSGVAVLPVAVIAPAANQPRKMFDEVPLQELADSIRERGVLQPILVRPLGADRYEIVAGERRWRASQLAGLHEIPVVIREMAELASFEAALIENIQRADLNPLEEARGYERLMRDFGHTQDMVATLTGKSRSHVANLLRLLELPQTALLLVEMGVLSLGHAKAVLAARDPNRLAKDIAEQGMSVRQAEAEAKRSHQPPRFPTARPAPERKSADIEALEVMLEGHLGLRVTVETKGEMGTVTLRFSDLDQLDLLLAKLQA